ncbi:unnamed protein product [Effrenium voratum]|nr:unnamed protein product [Effrenium voratum]
MFSPAILANRVPTFGLSLKCTRFGAHLHPKIVMESDSDGDDVQAKRLRFTDALTEVPHGDAEFAAELMLQDRGYTTLDSLEPFKNLKKLELKGNKIASLGFLEMNHSLCWLGLAKNRLRRITHLQNLSSLAVLDLSDNRVARLDGLQGLQGLKALIAARNNITLLAGISVKSNPLLETLVLSNNKLSDVSLAGFKHLKKLSLGHNHLRAFPKLKKLPLLSELRLNGNQITTIPHLVTVLPHLTTLDVGKNLINQPAAFEALKGLLWLLNVNVRGNPASGEGEMPQEIQDVLATLPRLEIVNGKRHAGTIKKRRDLRRGRGRGGGRGRGCAESDSEEARPLRARGRGNSLPAGKKKKAGFPGNDKPAGQSPSMERAVGCNAEKKVKTSPVGAADLLPRARKVKKAAKTETKTGKKKAKVQ